MFKTIIQQTPFKDGPTLGQLNDSTYWQYNFVTLVLEIEWYTIQLNIFSIRVAPQEIQE